MLYQRFLLPENVQTGATITPLSDEPMRRYLGENVERVSVNLHPIVATYFQRLIFDQRPTGADDDVIDALRMSAFWRALYGYGIVARQGDRYLAIDPRFWWPVLVGGVKVGSIIVMPYRRDPGTSGAQVTVPDRAWVAIANDADPRVVLRDHEWSGVTLGRQIEERIASPGRIAVWGDGIGEFTAAGIWALDEVSARLSGLSKTLKRLEGIHLQAPASAIELDSEGRPTLSISSDGSVLPVQTNDKDWKYVQLDNDNPLLKYSVLGLCNVIAANTSIPVDEFGFAMSVSRAETGNAIAVENHVTVAKARLWQNEITQAARELGHTLRWPQGQYASYTERVQSVIAMVTSGIMTIDEARERLL